MNDIDFSINKIKKSLKKLTSPYTTNKQAASTKARLKPTNEKREDATHDLSSHEVITVFINNKVKNSLNI